MPLQPNEPMSIPPLETTMLEGSDFELSFSMSLSMPTEIVQSELTVGEGGNSNTIILASSLAGVTALIIFAAAMFVKSRRGNNWEDCPEGSVVEINQVSPGSHDESNDIEAGDEEIS